MKKFFLFTVFVCLSLSLFAKEYFPGSRGSTRGELEAYMSLNNLVYKGNETGLHSEETDLTFCGVKIERLWYLYSWFNDKGDRIIDEIFYINMDNIPGYEWGQEIKTGREFINKVQNTLALQMSKSKTLMKDEDEKYYAQKGKWEFVISGRTIKIGYSYY